MTKICDTVYWLCESEKMIQAGSILSEFEWKSTLIKGPILSNQIYGTEGMRGYSSDVDILISRSNIKTMEKLLISQGYVCNDLDFHRERRVFMLSSSHQSFIKGFFYSAFFLSIGNVFLKMSLRTRTIRRWIFVLIWVNDKSKLLRMYHSRQHGTYLLSL